MGEGWGKFVQGYHSGRQFRKLMGAKYIYPYNVLATVRGFAHINFGFNTSRSNETTLKERSGVPDFFRTFKGERFGHT